MNRNGKWWRFKDYQIRNGRICPAEGSELTEYDPWQLHADAERHSRTVDAPYRALLDLAKALKNDPPRAPLSTDDAAEYQLSPQAEAAVLKWCRSFGLLGIFPLRLTLAATFQTVFDVAANRYMRMFNSENGTQFWRDDDVLGPISQVWVDLQQDFRRPPNVNDCVVAPPGSGKTEVAVQKLIALLSKRELADRVRTNEIDVFTFTRPDHDFTRADAGISSPDFWYSYSEPVDLFVTHTWRFLTCAQLVSQKFQGYTDAAIEEHTARAAMYLSALGSAGLKHRTFHVTSGVRDVERAPSLLCYFASMIFLDQENGRYMRNCEVCNSIFVSDDRRAIYCSPRCRKTKMMRNYRLARRPESPNPQ